MLALNGVIQDALCLRMNQTRLWRPVSTSNQAEDRQFEDRPISASAMAAAVFVDVRKCQRLSKEESWKIYCNTVSLMNDKLEAQTFLKR